MHLHLNQPKYMDYIIINETFYKNETIIMPILN